MSSGPLWQGPRAQRAPLSGEHEVDVCIVGAGFTGLWTAYYLARQRPDLSVLIIDAHTVGFGASGRNGGWCSALLPQSAAALARGHGRDAALAMRRAMQGTITEIARVIQAEKLDADWLQGGTVLVARSPAQWARAQAVVAHDRSWDGIDDWELLDSEQTRAHIGVPDALGASYTPHCARVHPGKLVRGLATVVERARVPIAENTRAIELRPGLVRTEHGTIRARHIIRATEAWTAQLPGSRRAVVPVYSLVVATAPLGPDFWTRAGLSRGQTFSDHGHLVVYGQRTADDRLVFGGRGAPYHFGSAIKPEYDLKPAVFRELSRALTGFFPYLGEPEITHRWGGPLGISRDWHASVRYDPATGLGSAGGYVGDGLSTTNLAGRTLAELIAGQRTERTTLPWVHHRSRSWEPEPLRWVGINAGLQLARLADASEARFNRSFGLARVLSTLTGH